MAELLLVPSAMVELYLQGCGAQAVHRPQRLDENPGFPVDIKR